MVVVKLVLKSGGIYNQSHVKRMQDMIGKYVKCDYKLVCYSDIQFDFSGELRPLINNWKGWWSKIELFREAENSFYIDLDMTIAGDITDMVTCESSFMALRNMNPKIQGIGSAMMRWTADMRHVYQCFNPDIHMAENNSIGKANWGDQGYIFKMVKAEYFQDAFPNRIFKFNEKRGDVRVYYGKHKPF